MDGGTSRMDANDRITQARVVHEVPPKVEGLAEFLSHQVERPQGYLERTISTSRGESQQEATRPRQSRGSHQREGSRVVRPRRGIEMDRRRSKEAIDQRDRSRVVTTGREVGPPNTEKVRNLDMAPVRHTATT